MAVRKANRVACSKNLKKRSTFSSRALLLLFLSLVVSVVASSPLALGARKLDSGLPGRGQGKEHSERPGEDEPFASLPLRFEPNNGQFRHQIRFAATTNGYRIAITDDGALFTVPGNTPGRKPAEHAGVTGKPSQRTNGAVSRDTASGKVKMTLMGSKGSTRIVGSDKLQGFSNYFVGAEPSGWRTGVPHFGKVTHKNAYPGIDLVYRGAGSGRLEYDFIVAPGADPRRIRLSYDNLRKIDLSKRGDLLLYTDDGVLRHNRPKIYQTVRGKKTPVTGGFSISQKEVWFWTGPYDKSKPLVIDPVVGYLRYLADKGDGGGQTGWDIATDGKGGAYIAGTTSSDDFDTTPNAAFPTAVPGDREVTIAFMTKLDATGENVYSTYLGGTVAKDGMSNPHREGLAISVDSSGDAYMAGRANLQHPTTPGAFRSVCAIDDGFVAKINPEIAGPASLIFSTCLIGEHGAGPQGIPAGARAQIDDMAVTDSIYLAGVLQCDVPRCMSAGGLGFPSGGYKSSFQGGLSDYFAAAMNLQGTRVNYFTYLGGSESEGIISVPQTAVDVDEAGIVYVKGTTYSKTDGTTGSFPRKHGHGTQPAGFFPGGSPFVAAIDTNLSEENSLVWSTLLGGRGLDPGDVAVDSDGSVYVTGAIDTDGLDSSANPTQLAGDHDAFLARFDPLQQAPGQSLSYPAGPDYFLYLGGSSTDEGRGIALEPGLSGKKDSKVLLVAGRTASADFKPMLHALDNTFEGSESFLAKIDTTKPSSEAVIYSTFLGGNGHDSSNSVAVDSAGVVYLTGVTNSDGFGPGFTFKNRRGRQADAFVAQLKPALPEVTIDPKFGPKAGGTPIVVTGANLKGSDANTKVYFGDRQIPFTPDPAEPDKRLLIVSPAFAGNISEHVKVATWEGMSIDGPGNLFTYQDLPPGVPAEGPVITAILPPSGDKAGGTAVSITGARFTGATQVSFGGVTIPASNFKAAFDTEIRLDTPPHDRAEPVAVTVTTAQGTSGPGQFTYTEAILTPVLSSRPDPGAGVPGGTQAAGQKTVFAAPPGGGGLGSPSLSPIPVTAPAPGALTAPAPGANPGPGTSSGMVTGAANEVGPGAALAATSEAAPEAATRHAMVIPKESDGGRLWAGAAFLGTLCLLAGAYPASRSAGRREEVLCAAPQISY